MDVLAANPLFRAFYADLYATPGNQRNLARFTFLDPASRRFYPGWDAFADITVAIVRTEAGRNPHDKDLHDLVGELSTRSDEFRTRWGAHNVRHHSTGTKHFHHHAVGGLALAYEGLDMAAVPGLTLTVYTAEPGSPSEEGLRLLASWAATEEAAPAGSGRPPADPSCAGRLPEAGVTRRGQGVPLCGQTDPGPARNEDHMQVGYKLSAEAFGPAELVRQAVLAEEAGFDFVEISDHYHPWLDNQGHSPFAWTVLGPSPRRRHGSAWRPGSPAPPCATTRDHRPGGRDAGPALGGPLRPGRRLGGAAQRTRRRPGFPEAVSTRHELLTEALEIIRLLWSGGYRSYEGKHLRLSDARVFDLPDELPLIAVAASGPKSTRIAAELGDGLFATEDKPSIVRHYRDAGGSGPCYAEVPMAWAPDAHTGARAALETTRWALTGWKVMSELPNPVNFDAATATVREEDILGKFACGTDPDRYVEVAQPFVDAGYDRLVMQNAGPDPDGFIDFYRRELDTRIRQLRPNHG